METAAQHFCESLVSSGSVKLHARIKPDRERAGRFAVFYRLADSLATIGAWENGGFETIGDAKAHARERNALHIKISNDCLDRAPLWNRGRAW